MLPRPNRIALLVPAQEWEDEEVSFCMFGMRSDGVTVCCAC